MSVELDQIQIEVIGNAFLSVVEEMGETLVKSSYSTNIKERRDCSTALFDLTGQTLAQAEHIPVHLGSMLGIVQAVLERHPLEDIKPGDAFIANDPYSGGGTHLPDLALLSPVFWEDRPVAFLANLAHHADFMDRGHAHIFQEGLRIPPVRIIRDGEIQTDIVELILNNCQVPRERRGDLQAQFAANRLGQRRMIDLCRRYGDEVIAAAGRALLDYAERKTRAGIAVIPDGEYFYTDIFDSPKLDHALDLKIRIEIRGDTMHLDFSGNPPQGRHALNIVWTALLATVYYAVKTLVDPTIQPNAGLYRPIEVFAPPGSIVNAVAPAAVDSRTQTCQRVVDLIYGALAEAIPERVTAAHNGANTAIHLVGTDPKTGEIYTYLETLGGGFGARATKDGLDGVQVHVTNTSNLPVEALEQEYPLMIERYEMIPDSGGPGRFRGGMGLLREIKVVASEVEFGYSSTRIESAPWGLFGGLPGGRAGLEVKRAETGPPPERPTQLRTGDSLVITTAGGGGYQDPKTRDRDLVASDLKQGKITPQSALETYGLEV